MLNTLCIDVVVGSVLSGLFITRILNVEPGWAYWIVLPLSVWIVYTLDHLIDANRLKNYAHTNRHRFVYRYFLPILVLVIFLIVINFILVILFLNIDVLFFGISVGLFTAFYFFLLHLAGSRSFLFLQKEFFVALIYSVGLWGVPSLLSNFNFSDQQWYLFVSFIALAISNTMVLSIYETETDKKDGHSSFPLNFGTKVSNSTVSVLVFLVFVSSIYLIVTMDELIIRTAAKIFIIMAMLTIVLISFPQLFRKNQLYRILTEIIFWLPGLLMLV